MKTILRLTLLFVLLLSISCTTGHTSIGTYTHANFTHAAQRTQNFIDAINQNQSDIVYDMLCEEYRNQLSKDEFVKRFADDRSYPYLTPLYLHLVSLTIPQRSDGQVACSVAARLEGEFFRFSIRYEQGEYYFLVFGELIDGSYREKFPNQVVKWI
ncbi:MAG: hypothetical protein AB7D92_10330 [Sphaerochaeta sp.]